MTKKDYKLIAGAIAETRECYGPLDGQKAVDALAQRMANTLRTDNPRFDYVRFLAACGVPEEEWNQ